MEVLYQGIPQLDIQPCTVEQPLPKIVKLLVPSLLDGWIREDVMVPHKWVHRSHLGPTGAQLWVCGKTEPTDISSDKGNPEDLHVEISAD